MASGEKTVETIVKGVIVLLAVEWAIKHQDIIKGWIDNFTMSLQMQTMGAAMMPATMNMSAAMMPSASAQQMMVTPVAVADNTPVAAFDCSKLASCTCIDVGGSCKCMGNSNCSCSSCVAGSTMVSAVVPSAAKNVAASIAKPAAAVPKKIGVCGLMTPCGTMCTLGNAMMFRCCPVGKTPTNTVSARVCAMTNRCVVQRNGSCM